MADVKMTLTQRQCLDNKTEEILTLELQAAYHKTEQQHVIEFTYPDEHEEVLATIEWDPVQRWVCLNESAPSKRLTLELMEGKRIEGYMRTPVGLIVWEGEMTSFNIFNESDRLTVITNYRLLQNDIEPMEQQLEFVIWK